MKKTKSEKEEKNKRELTKNNKREGEERRGKR
jgi:hypothetical protein